MEQHLEAVSTDPDVTFTVQHAVDKGLDKLKKYSDPAKLHHSYILGTILHPCLRSHWFASTAQPNDEDTQKQAIETAEVIFRYIAEHYLETSTPPPAPAIPPKPAAKPVAKTSSFLASACAFQRPPTATSSTIRKRTAKEELVDELDRYLRFDAAPISEQEQDENTRSNEPSREEVLLNPLLWWKIHATEFPTIALMARDYLAIPATSVSVEHVFSKSRHICTDLRSSLKESTIKMALLTKVWIRSGLFEMMPRKILRRKHGDNAHMLAHLAG